MIASTCRCRGRGGKITRGKKGTRISGLIDIIAVGYNWIGLDWTGENFSRPGFVFLSGNLEFLIRYRMGMVSEAIFWFLDGSSGLMYMIPTISFSSSTLLLNILPSIHLSIHPSVLITVP